MSLARLDGVTEEVELELRFTNSNLYRSLEMVNDTGYLVKVNDSFFLFDTLSDYGRHQPVPRRRTNYDKVANYPKEDISKANAIVLFIEQYWPPGKSLDVFFRSHNYRFERNAEYGIDFDYRKNNWTAKVKTPTGYVEITLNGSGNFIFAGSDEDMYRLETILKDHNYARKAFLRHMMIDRKWELK